MSATETKRTGPSINRGGSRQDYGTPRVFLDAVERRFGPIVLDVAANEANHVAPEWLGPGSPWPDALTVDWWRFAVGNLGGLRWCNPPFDEAPAFARKCADEGKRGVSIALLTPASVSTEWFAQHIHGRALVLAIRPRIVFVGETQGYPKDLMLSVWDRRFEPGFECWRWDR